MMAATTMDGPNGTGVLRPFPFIFSTIIPAIMPITEAKNNVSNVGTVPNTKPINKNSLISPPPIPPLETMAINNKSEKPTAAPTILSHHGSNGDTILPTMKNGKKNNKILFGINI